MILEKITHRPPKEVYQKKSGPLTVLGTAACVWDDLEKLGRDKWGEVMTINDITQHFTYFTKYPVSHSASMHPELLPHFVSLAEKQESPIVTHGNKPGCDYIWNIIGVTHSGVFGVMAGMLMGYDPIFLCGMPCDATPYYFGPQKRPGTWYANENGSARSAWRLFEPYLKGKVFSMSGWTKELLNVVSNGSHDHVWSRDMQSFDSRTQKETGLAER